MSDTQKKAIYIFKLNALFRPEDVKSIRDEIKRQLDEGLLLLDHNASFVGRELEVCGQKVTVEFVERDEQEAKTE